MMLHTVNWGMIGCGSVAEVKSGPALYKTPNSKLVAVMRRNADAAADYAHRHGVGKWYTSADLLINDPGVNAIYIATPPSSHKDYALMAIKAQKPVYIEKPMALNFRECREILEASQLANVPVFVAYYRRALPYFIKIKEIVLSGLLGEIKKVSLTLNKAPKNADKDENNLPWRVKPEVSGGGYFVDLGSHQLDILLFIFGSLRFQSAIVKNMGWIYHAEDYVTAQFTLGKNIPCLGTWNFMAQAQNEIDSLVIQGTKGQLNASTFGNRTFQLRIGDRIETIEFEPPKHIQQPLVQCIVDELTTATPSCPSTGASASLTNQIIDQVLYDYYHR